MTEQERRTALVTGSSSGFGRAAVELFRTQGWNVVATTRRPDAWQEDPADDLLVCALDIRDADSVDAALAQTVQRFGRLDCLVNNAGAGLLSVFAATPMTAVRDLFEVNVFGMMRVTQSALPYLSASSGRVVNVASGSGIVPEPLMSVYGATKFAVEGFTESLRYELAPHGVVVKLVEPGLVRETNFIQNTVETSQSVPVPPAYEHYVHQVISGYLGESPHRLATPSAVAEAILAAATDHTTQLRYPVGEDIEASARMRHETDEKSYNAWALAKYAAVQ
ncbi:SDR family oxidoreductase [Nocardia alni]|uniref:SDR family oxidoreductase n=1 Tax=Nocardia alni TaxID=2815723 RepID=UPI001C21440A|nr:SDR family oxidoreductase [Nocardia alni]